MKTKLFKRIGLLGLSTLAAFTLTSNVKAEEQCTTYTNYYFFSEINDFEAIKSNVQTGGDEWFRSHRTFFQGLPSSAKDVQQERVCLDKNGTKDGTCSVVWTLTDYYNRYKQIVSNGSRVDINTPKGSDNNTVLNADNTTKYYKHGYWYEVQNGTIGNTGTAPTNIEEVALASLINGSFFPTSTNISFSFDDPSGATIATVDRTIKSANYAGVTPFASGAFNQGVLTPTIYKVTYKDDCHEATPKYKAIINYYYWDMQNDKPTTNKVVFEDDTKPNPYTANNLEYTYTTNVPSPKAKNKTCTPLEESVDVAKPSDSDTFTHDVYYKCTGYEANIHYCIEKADGTCIPATDVDKKAKDYSKKGLENGDEDKVSSHTIKNCKLKKDSDKTVSYKIENDDFSYEVRYICDDEAAPANPKTGIALIITAWTVGLGALGYSAYYFINAKKEENAEL